MKKSQLVELLFPSFICLLFCFVGIYWSSKFEAQANQSARKAAMMEEKLQSISCSALDKAVVVEVARSVAEGPKTLGVLFFWASLLVGAIGVVCAAVARSIYRKWPQGIANEG